MGVSFVEGEVPFLTADRRYVCDLPEGVRRDAPELFGVLLYRARPRGVLYRRVPAGWSSAPPGASHQFDVAEDGRTVEVFYTHESPPYYTAVWGLGGGLVVTYMQAPDPQNPNSAERPPGLPGLRRVIAGVRITEPDSYPLVHAGGAVSRGNLTDPEEQGMTTFLPDDDFPAPGSAGWPWVRFRTERVPGVRAIGGVSDVRMSSNYGTGDDDFVGAYASTPYGVGVYTEGPRRSADELQAITARVASTFRPAG
jgi:hypothetical protein